MERFLVCYMDMMTYSNRGHTIFVVVVRFISLALYCVFCIMLTKKSFS